MVVCTTNGNGGSRMRRRWDADEPAAEAETPPVGGDFDPGAPPPVDSMLAGSGHPRHCGVRSVAGSQHAGATPALAAGGLAAAGWCRLQR